jgi:hypothetical protein
VKHYLLALIAALLYIPLTSGSSHATNYWSCPGNSHVPTDVSIQGDRYLITGSAIKHKSGSTATITAFCEIPQNTGATNPNRLFVRYTDSTGTGADSRVRVRFIRRSRSSSTVTTVTDFSSNSFANTTESEQFVSVSHTLDFTINVYYTRTDLTRALTSQKADLEFASLDFVVD